MNLCKMEENHKYVLANAPELEPKDRQDVADLCAQLATTLSEIAMYSENHKYWKDEKGYVNENVFYNIPQTQREGVNKPKIWCAIDDQTSVLSDKYAKELTLVDKASDFMYHLLTLADSYNIEFDDEYFDKNDLDTMNETNASIIYLDTLMYIVEFKSYNSNWNKFVLSYILNSFKSYVKVLGLSEKDIENDYFKKYHADLNVPLSTINLLDKSESVISDSDLHFNSLCESLGIDITDSESQKKKKNKNFRIGGNAFLKLVDR